MIRQNIDIDKYGWTVYVYYAVTTYYVDEIVNRMANIGCEGEMMLEAWANMLSGKLNTGLTYSNYGRRETVLVIAKTSSAREFINSLVHELGHLVKHIAQANGMDPYGEEVQYLSGEIAMRMFDVCHDLLCDGCRKEAIYEG